MKEYAQDYSVAELMCTRLSKEIENGDVTVLGSFTPLAFASYILAKITHAPNCVLITYISSIDTRPFQLSFTGAEAAATRGANLLWTGLEILTNIHSKGRGDVEAVSSIQADQYGNINISVLGEYEKPKLRGPGGSGAAEVIKMHRKMIGYFPNHNKFTFVPKVDFITGNRYLFEPEERIKAGYRPGPIRYVTSLAVMVKEHKDTPFKIESLHPGITADQVIENTGFELEFPSSIPETEKPTKEEIRLIREVIDPLNTMAFDFKPGKERLGYLHEILQKELEAIGYSGV